ncbi:2OG-Fe(II) oxygenase family protein [Providencia sp. PROV110]|uniref:2OG-Fe(II) oxygenase family protein n=1 Tax=Providencia sp. PROV110 TaxID=2949821 RepID=UPI0023495504|nr:2OG-Fe(II) oxygenase family protein [Providencia sp. PROV110]
MGISKHNKEFLSNGYTSFSIKDFFPEFEVNLNLINNIEDDKWSFIIKNRRGVSDFYLSDTDIESINYEKTIAFEDRDNGEFSFSFRRICFDEIKIILVDLIAVVDDVKFKDFLWSITGKKVNMISNIYLSKFDKNDFLTTHCDSDDGIGIVINLTKKWEANYGGLTMILDNEKKEILETFIPSYLNILIFDTKKRKIPHFVSTVISNKISKRMALVVRYNEKN